MANNNNNNNNNNYNNNYNNCNNNYIYIYIYIHKNNDNDNNNNGNDNDNNNDNKSDSGEIENDNDHSSSDISENDSVNNVSLNKNTICIYSASRSSCRNAETLEPGPPDPESSALTMRPPHLHIPSLWGGQKLKSTPIFILPFHFSFLPNSVSTLVGSSFFSIFYFENLKQSGLASFQSPNFSVE